jgi:hypothetical protein
MSANGFLFGNAARFTFRDKPALATQGFESTALGNLFAEAGQQLLLGFVIS